MARWGRYKEKALNKASVARNDRQSSAAQRYRCSSPWFLIDVGTSIPESSGVHAEVASYKTMNGLSDEKISPDKMDPLICPSILKLS
jgi:hypothetical protein